MVSTKETQFDYRLRRASESLARIQLRGADLPADEDRVCELARCGSLREQDELISKWANESYRDAHQDVREHFGSGRNPDQQRAVRDYLAARMKK